MSRSSDILIVGAGAYGLSTAFWLRKLRPDLSVTVLDRSDFAGNETGRCCAGIRVQWGARGNIRLCWEALPMFENFAEIFSYPDGIDFKQTGYAILCHQESHLAQLRRNAEVQREVGIVTEFLSPQELSVMAPAINIEGLVGASFYARDGSVSPFRVLDGCYRAARREGADIRYGVTVRSLQRHGDGFTLESSEGIWQAGKVVLATDTRIPELAGQLGVDIPVRPQPNQAMVTEPLPPLLGPCIMAFAKEMFINQVARGNFVILCGDKRRAMGFDHAPTADLFPSAAQRAISLIPQLAQARVLRTWGGLYSVTPDMQPVLGESAVAGLYIALSSAKGFMTGPAAGRIMAQIIDGQTVDPWVPALTPNRFQGNVVLDAEPAVI